MYVRKSRTGGPAANNGRARNAAPRRVRQVKCQLAWHNRPESHPCIDALRRDLTQPSLTRRTRSPTHAHNRGQTPREDAVPAEPHANLPYPSKCRWVPADVDLARPPKRGWQASNPAPWPARLHVFPTVACRSDDVVPVLSPRRVAPEDILSGDDDESACEVAPGYVGYAVKTTAGTGDAVDVLQQFILVSINESGVH